MVPMVGVRTGGHFSFVQLETSDEGSQMLPQIFSSGSMARRVLPTKLLGFTLIEAIEPQRGHYW
jgi:hypothetical protein